MSNVIIDDTYLGDIADAIRGKNGSLDTYTPADMAAAIAAIQTGGGVSNKTLNWARSGLTETYAQNTSVLLNGKLTSFKDIETIVWFCGNAAYFFVYTRAMGEQALSHTDLSYIPILGGSSTCIRTPQTGNNWDVAGSSTSTSDIYYPAIPKSSLFNTNLNDWKTREATTAYFTFQPSLSYAKNLKTGSTGYYNSSKWRMCVFYSYEN